MVAKALSAACGVLMAAWAFLCAAAPVAAQTFPTKPIRIIVGFAAGCMRRWQGRSQGGDRRAAQDARRVVVGDTPAEFKAYLDQDVERWERVIAASGLKAE
jgi:tripartite-type tricarboxylate transporter receptor subunit TctC